MLFKGWALNLQPKPLFKAWSISNIGILARPSEPCPPCPPCPPAPPGTANSHFVRVRKR